MFLEINLFVRTCTVYNVFFVISGNDFLFIFNTIIKWIQFRQAKYNTFPFKFSEFYNILQRGITFCQQSQYVCSLTFYGSLLPGETAKWRFYIQDINLRKSSFQRGNWTVKFYFICIGFTQRFYLNKCTFPGGWKYVFLMKQFKTNQIIDRQLQHCSSYFCVFCSVLSTGGTSNRSCCMWWGTDGRQGTMS